MKTFQGIDDLVLAVGSELGHSDWHSVTQSQIDQFAAATGDDQWIHTDADRAARGPYGATIAHGYLTVALIPRLLHQVFVVEGLTMRVNYGSNRIRFRPRCRWAHGSARSFSCDVRGVKSVRPARCLQSPSRLRAPSGRPAWRK